MPPHATPPSSGLPHIASTRMIHQGYRFTFEEITLVERRADGSPITRDIVRHPGAVVIVPVLDDGRIVMIRNYRPTLDCSLWELCAGTLDHEGEEPIACAGRELVEETGYEAGVIEPLGCFYTTPGLTDELMYAFLATDLRQVGQSLEPGEHISVSMMEMSEIENMIRAGDFQDGKSLVAYFLFKQRKTGETSGQRD